MRLALVVWCSILNTTLLSPLSYFLFLSNCHCHVRHIALRRCGVPMNPSLSAANLLTFGATAGETFKVTRVMEPALQSPRKLHTRVQCKHFTAEIEIAYCVDSLRLPRFPAFSAFPMSASLLMTVACDLPNRNQYNLFTFPSLRAFRYKILAVTHQGCCDGHCTRIEDIST